MVKIYNQTSTNIDSELINQIAKSLTNKEIELLIVNSDEMQKINKEHRGVDGSTDVLSFPFEDIPYAPLGSIVINIDKAKNMAKSLNHTLNDEIALLFIHGILHLLGYDHECDKGEMREREKEIINSFNLPESLIIRTESGS
jgi:probable rRNA maturation factor